jgi:hypothetical protein
VEEEPIGSLLHRDAEELVEGAEVLHGKLLLESRSCTLKKLRTQGGEDDVVDIEKQIRDVSGVTINTK